MEKYLGLNFLGLSLFWGIVGYVFSHFKPAFAHCCAIISYTFSVSMMVMTIVTIIVYLSRKINKRKKTKQTI